MHLQSIRYFREHLAAAFTMLLMQVGRWTPARLGDGLAPAGKGMLDQPRLWLVLGLWFVVMLSLMPRTNERIDPQPNRTRQFALLNGFGVVLLTYMAMTVAWAPDEQLGFSKLREVCLLLGGLVAIHLLTVRLDGEKIRSLFWLYFLGLGLIFTAAGIRNLGSGRVAVLGGGPNVFGRTMGLLFLTLHGDVDPSQAGVALGFPGRSLFPSRCRIRITRGDVPPCLLVHRSFSS